MIKQMIRLMI